MKTLEDVFINEFKKEIVQVGDKDIYKIPLPESAKDWKVSGVEYYQVQGIEEEYYKELNDTQVSCLPRGEVAEKRIVDKVTRGYQKNDDGSYKHEKFKVPTGSVVVISDKSIDLPYLEYKNSTIQGYGYVDFVEKDGKVEYMYALPKKVLYKCNQTALALSVRNMKNYEGQGYKTWQNGTIFLHIIPYKSTGSYVGTRILETKLDLDYHKEIQEILDYWQKINLIPNLTLTQLSNGENLAYKNTVTGYDGYQAVELSALGEKGIYGEDEQEEE